MCFGRPSENMQMRELGRRKRSSRCYSNDDGTGTTVITFYSESATSVRCRRTRGKNKTDTKRQQLTCRRANIFFTNVAAANAKYANMYIIRVGENPGFVEKTQPVRVFSGFN